MFTPSEFSGFQAMQLRYQNNRFLFCVNTPCRWKFKKKALQKLL